MEIKQSTSFRVPVRLVDADGVAITGSTFSQITTYIQKQAGTATLKSLTSDDWYEISSTNMPGLYDLNLSVSDTDTIGYFKYYITKSGATPYIGLLEIVANVESDTYQQVIANGGITKILGKPVSSIADDIKQVGKITQDIQKKVS